MSQATGQIDAVFAALWPGVVAQQAGYYAANQAYYQMLWTHSEPPASATAPDNLTARPTDQPASPIQGLPATMRSRMRIDTYGKPDGWTVTMQSMIGGELWERCIDSGVDARRSRPWAVVVEPPAPPVVIATVTP
jgi:hypothetical protein